MKIRYFLENVGENYNLKWEQSGKKYSIKLMHEVVEEKGMKGVEDMLRGKCLNNFLKDLSFMQTGGVKINTNSLDNKIN